MKNCTQKFAFGFISAALLALGATAPAAAEQLVALSGEVMVERTVMENGAETTVLAAPESVVPGDNLVFSTMYRNDSGDVVENFVVTNPLPAAVRLTQDDASFEVSVDGGTSFARLDTLTVAEEGAQRAATLDDVTHLRWTLARLEPGASGTLSYSAVVR